MVLVDALRWDYPQRAAFLSGLWDRSITGRLVEPFGFTPRFAYFQGVDVAPGGFTHMFEWNPEASPFGMSRFLPLLQEPATATRLREALRQRARVSAAPFAADYIDPAAIPQEYLRFFDVAEKVSPWGPDLMNDSLFGLLRSHGQSAYVCAWPETNGLTDAAIVARTLHGLNADARFAFVHLSGLDAAGHMHGPGSVELQRALEETDRHLRTLVEHAVASWRYPRVIVFGDHGMVQVVERVDVMPSIAATGLTFGRDFGFFVDSTVVRFWYFAADARHRVRAALAGLSGGRFLDEDDRLSFGLDRAGWRNGEDFFLAAPGVLFSPSFFGHTALHGMHGYDPGCLDNQGAFLYWNPADETPRDAGTVRASRLFSTTLAACDIPVPCGAPAPVVAKLSARRKRSFTSTALPRHEGLIEGDLARIIDRVLLAVPDCEAIVLTGSFGRGEGVVRDQTLRAVNDYDLMVIGGRPRENLDDVRTELESHCHVDAIDLGWSDPSRPIGASQFGMDLRGGSTLLYGDPAILETWGTPAPGTLTMADAWLGLSNRACGLLEVIAPPEGSTGESARRQLIKFAVALGDGYLVLFGDYHVRIASRVLRFHDLARAAGLPDATIQAICAGYRAKLGLQPAGDVDLQVRCLFDAAAALAFRSAGMASPVTLAPGEAVRGRRRQSGTACGELPSLPPEFATELEDIYREGWDLLAEIAAGRPSDPWSGRRDGLIKRWRKVIH